MHILDKTGVHYSNDDLPRLYGKTAEALNLAPSQHTEATFKAILGGCYTIVQNLGSLRNKLSDAHGQGKHRVRPLPRHATLAVNLAGGMSTFLIETWNTKNNLYVLINARCVGADPTNLTRGQSPRCIPMF